MISGNHMETPNNNHGCMNVAGYETLAHVLNRAYQQAVSGKGAERHAQSAPFHQQPMQLLCNLYGRGFALGQAAKKMQEAQRLPVDRAVHELLGAINYIAGAIIHLEGNDGPTPANDNVLGQILNAPRCDHHHG